MPFENVSCQGCIENFSGRGHKFCHFFQAQFFPAELIISNLNNKRTLGGLGTCFPGKFLKICIL